VKSTADHLQFVPTVADVLSNQSSDEMATGCKLHAVVASSVTDIGATSNDSSSSAGLLPQLNLAATTESTHSTSSGTSYANTLQTDMDGFEEVNRKVHIYHLLVLRKNQLFVLVA